MQDKVRLCALRHEVLKMVSDITPLEKEIVKILKKNRSSYANPVNSVALGEQANVAPSYIRHAIKNLCERGMVGVRKGPGGGYYLCSGEEFF